jgi:hypothetical protein
MKKATLLLLIGLLALTGCVHHYVLRLNNGAEITTATKPQLREGVYYFKDAKGEEHVVAASRVREMAPASMAAKEEKVHSAPSAPPKKRHWYLLWLG